MNFRDNGLYIANPIYIRIRYFEYYLTQDTVLKFDWMIYFIILLTKS